MIFVEENISASGKSQIGAAVKKIFGNIWNFLNKAQEKISAFWQKAKEPLGWTTLLTAFTVMVAGLASFVITPPSSMQGRDGRKFVLFEQVFRPNEVRKENRAALEESISKALVKKAQDRRDSVAAVQRAHNDSIKAAMAVKKMKPRHVVAKPQMRLPQKH